MFLFVLGVIIVYTAACASILGSDEAVRTDNPWVLAFALVAWAAPVGASWLTAEVVDLLRPARALNPTMSWGLVRFVRGLIAGAFGVGLSLAALVYVSKVPADAVIMAAGSAIATAAVLLCSRRPRPGTCRACGYDLRGLTASAMGRCPECGHAVVRATAIC